MARADDFRLPPIILTFFTPQFESVDYSLELNNPFEITNPLDAFQKQAGAKGCVVVLQASLIPANLYYGETQPQPEGETPNEPQPE